MNLKHLVALLSVLLIAAAVRVPRLGRHGYTVDEMWATEIATGRGSLHQRIVLDELTPAPELFRLSDAPPWWQVWTHMEVTHPPLHSILLRWWEDLFGDSDVSGRALSVAASLIAIALFYDAVRLMNGPTAAFWAAVLMALAIPQVDQARQTRNYAALVAVAMAMTDALVRIEKIGLTRRRWVGLCLATLATLLTHYFCIGAIVGLMVYSAIRFSGRLRLNILAAFVIAGLVFAMVWGPFMWRQSRFFSTDDQATLFLSPDESHHVLKTVERALLVPASLLFPPMESNRWLAVVPACLYLLPLALFRKRPEVFLWGCWLAGTVGVVAGLDLTRHTTHLFFPRYTMLAGPAVYALAPSLFFGFKPARWLVHAIPTAAAIGCAAAIPDLYITHSSDPSEITRDFVHPLRTNDLLLFAADPNSRMDGELQYMLIDRYLGPIPCPVALLIEPASDEVQARIDKSDAAYLFTPDLKLSALLPHSHPFESRMYIGRGYRFRLK